MASSYLLEFPLESALISLPLVAQPLLRRIFGSCLVVGSSALLVLLRASKPLHRATAKRIVPFRSARMRHCNRKKMTTQSLFLISFSHTLAFAGIINVRYAFCTPLSQSTDDPTQNAVRLERLVPGAAHRAADPGRNVARRTVFRILADARRCAVHQLTLHVVLARKSVTQVGDFIRIRLVFLLDANERDACQMLKPLSV